MEVCHLPRHQKRRLLKGDRTKYSVRFVDMHVEPPLNQAFNQR